MRLTFTIPLADDGSIRVEHKRKTKPKKRAKRPKTKAKTRKARK